MDHIFIVFGHYLENNQKEFDILLVANSETKCMEYYKNGNKNIDTDSAYIKYSGGTFDVE